MNVLHGDALLAIEPIETERYQLHQVMEYLSDSSDKRVCTLYGLRRTGKTTIMEQAIHKLLNQGISSSRILYITGQKEQYEDIASVYVEIDKLISERAGTNNVLETLYVFVDEIGWFNGFISWAAKLYDYYTRTQKIKVVIAGTNLVSLYIAGLDSLYDRMYKIQVHHLTFYEHCKFVLNGTEPSWPYFCQYLKTGGLFEKTDTSEYMDTCIIAHLEDTLNYGEPREVLRWIPETKSTEVNWTGLMNNICLFSAANVNEKNVVKYRGFRDDIQYLNTIDPNIVIDREVIEECVNYYHMTGIRSIPIKKNEIQGLLKFLESCGFIFLLENRVAGYAGDAAKMYLTFPFFRFSYTLKLAEFADIAVEDLSSDKGCNLMGSLLEGCVVSEYKIAYPDRDIKFWREGTESSNKVKAGIAECDLIDFTDMKAFEIKWKKDTQYSGFYYLQQLHGDWGLDECNCKKLCGEEAMNFIYGLGYVRYKGIGPQDDDKVLK